MNDVLVIVPSRSRPDSSIAFAEAFSAHSTRSDLIFALDDDDPVEYPRLDSVGYEVNPRLRLTGTLNLVATKYLDQYRYLGFMGDDHRIRTPGWDRLLIEAIGDLPAGIAYGNDLVEGPAVPTAALMNADIVRILGFMALPGLVHFYVDIVWWNLGKALGSLRYRDDVIIEHLRVHGDKSKQDETYRQINASDAIARDSAIYQQYTRSRLELDIAKLQFLLPQDSQEMHSVQQEGHAAFRSLADTPGDRNARWTMPRILNATYGAGDCVTDVTMQLRALMREGSAGIAASNSQFGDPCPQQLKTLRFSYLIPGDDRLYTQEVPEQQQALLPVAEDLPEDVLEAPDGRAAPGSRDNSLGNPTAKLRILHATYGAGDCVADVMTQIQELIDNGSLPITASNTLFGDPCPSLFKSLRVTYQLPGDDRLYIQQVPEHQAVLLPDAAE